MEQQRGYVILSLVAVLAAVSAYAMYERAARIGLQGKVQTLESANKEQAQTITTTLEISKSSIANSKQLQENIDEISNRSRQFENELTTLRATEQQDAFKQPFARGNAACERRRQLLRRFDEISGDPDPPSTYNPCNPAVPERVIDATAERDVDG